MCLIHISVTLLFEIKLHSFSSSCSYWRVPVHDGQLVRSVLVLLVLGHLPPAAGAAQLPRVVAVAVGVLIRVLVLLRAHGFEVGEALLEHGEGHIVVAGVNNNNNGFYFHNASVVFSLTGLRHICHWYNI